MGRATARLLSEMGAEVYSLDKASPQKTESSITDIECDISSEKSLKAALKSIKLGKKPVQGFTPSAMSSIPIGTKSKRPSR